MKLLRIIADGLPLFKEQIDISFYAVQRINEEQKGMLYPLFSNIYLNTANGFIGINASGKTSALKLIKLSLAILNNEPINHIDCKNILGDSNAVSFQIYFYSEKEKEICLLKSVIESRKDILGTFLYRFQSESLYTKKSKDVKTRKSLFDFDLSQPCIVRDSKEEFLPDDVSIMISRNKKTEEHIPVIDMLPFTNENIPVMTKDVPLSILSFLDPSIESLHFEEKSNQSRIHLKFIGKKEILLSSANELSEYLSSGTIKGMIAFRLATDILKNGGYLIIDEIENHFNKEIVATLLRLFTDGKLNRNGGSIIYSTHYPELLDEYERNDSLFITRNEGGITITNLSNLLKRNDIKKSDAYQSGLLEGTVPSYDSYMKLKKYIFTAIKD